MKKSITQAIRSLKSPCIVKFVSSIALSTIFIDVSLADNDALNRVNSSQSSSWPYYGGDLHQTNSASDPGDISVSSVKNRGFRLIWSRQTDPNFVETAPTLKKKLGNITPAVIGNKLYYTSLGEQPVEYSPGKFRVEEVSDLGVIDTNTGEFLPGFPIALSSYSAAASALLGRDIRIRSSRSTPLVYNGQIIIGTRFASPSANPASTDPADDEYHKGVTTSLILSISASDSHLLWATLVDEHPATRMSMSLVAYKGLIYGGAAAPDYALAANPSTPCCNSRGSVFALDPANGHIVWKTYTTPPAAGEENYDGAVGSTDPIHKSIITRTTGSWYSGASVWAGGAVVDEKNGLLIVGTGNNGSAPLEAKLCEKERRYSTNLFRFILGKALNTDVLLFSGLTAQESAFLYGDGVSAGRLNEIARNIGDKRTKVVCDRPDVATVILTDKESAKGKTINLNDAFIRNINANGHKSYGNYPGSLVAFDLKTGDIRWAYHSIPYDAYNTLCDFGNPAICPDPYGFDGDIAQPPILVSVGGNDVVLAATKKGLVIAVDAQNGKFYKQWTAPKKLGQMGIVGGSEFGSSSDGERYFVHMSHSNNTPLAAVPGGNFNKIDSQHSVCSAEIIDDLRIAVGMPVQRSEIDFPFKMPGCKIPNNYDGSRGITTTVADYLTGIDIATGQVLWQYADPSGDPNLVTFDRSFKLGGISVANNVVFSGNQLGVIRFHNGTNGQILREIDLKQLNGGLYANRIDAAPAIVGNRVYWATGLASTVKLIGGVASPFISHNDPRILAFELCPVGTHADPGDITQCQAN